MKFVLLMIFNMHQSDSWFTLILISALVCQTYISSKSAHKRFDLLSRRQNHPLSLWRHTNNIWGGKRVKVEVDADGWQLHDTDTWPNTVMDLTPTKSSPQRWSHWWPTTSVHSLLALKQTGMRTERDGSGTLGGVGGWGVAEVDGTAGQWRQMLTLAFNYTAAVNYKVQRRRCETVEASK